MTPMPPVSLRRYGDESEEIMTFASVEVNEGDVDVIVNPYTSEAQTFTLPPAEAWRPAREISRAATVAEDWDGDR